MDVDGYLERMAYQGPTQPTAATLSALQRAHLLAVPFENLDIHMGRPLDLSLPALYDKIVERRRGGLCYELNGLFAWLLQQLDFTVTLLSARVFEAQREGPEFDHLTLRVEGPQCGEPHLVDVGFGDSFLAPLRLQPAAESVQTSGAFRLAARGCDLLLERRRGADPWESQYAFAPTPRRLTDFEAMCLYHQTSPQSSFTRRTVCSRATPRGRITLANDRWIVTTPGGKTERVVAGAQEYRDLLRAHFGIDLGPDAPLARLMAPHPPT